MRDAFEVAKHQPTACVTQPCARRLVQPTPIARRKRWSGALPGHGTHIAPARDEVQEHHMIGFLILGMLTFAALYLLTNVLDRV